MAPRKATPARVLAGLAALIFFTVLAGCTAKGPQTDPSRDKKAAALALDARHFNASILTSKGVGRLIMERGGQKEIYEMAWAAQAPDRLRLTLLVSGRPVETIAASGEWITFVSHTGSHPPHSPPSTDPDLTDYIGIPIRLSEMISLLLGRVPVRSFDRARISDTRPDLVITRKFFSAALQELRFDPLGRVNRIRILDKDQTLVHGMILADFRDKKGFQVPTAMTIYTGSGRSLRLFIPDMVPNIPVNPSVFRLTAGQGQ